MSNDNERVHDDAGLEPEKADNHRVPEQFLPCGPGTARRVARANGGAGPALVAHPVVRGRHSIGQVVFKRPGFLGRLVPNGQVPKRRGAVFGPIVNGRRLEFVQTGVVVPPVVLQRLEARLRTRRIEPASR